MLAVSAVISLWAALQVSRLSHSPHLPARGQGAIADMLAGARTFAAEPGPRLVISLFASQAFVRGILNVLLVVTAFKLLDIGDSGVGLLTAAFGLGGLVGGLAGIALVGLRRLAQPFAAGLVMWGAPLALIAAWPNEPWALTCLAVVGAGNAILDVSGFTLIQRGIDDDVLARVFGVFEMLVVAAVGIGSIVGSLLVSQLGARQSLVVAGCLLPVPRRRELPAPAPDRRPGGRAAARAGGPDGRPALQPAAGDDARAARRRDSVTRGSSPAPRSSAKATPATSST